MGGRHPELARTLTTRSTDPPEETTQRQLAERPELFDEYVAWTRDLVAGLEIDPDELTRHLQVVDAGLALHPARPAVPRSLLEHDRRHGELHEIGGRMVADTFELHGWDSQFTGANTPSASVARMVADVGPDPVAISAPLPSHVPFVEEVIRGIHAVSSTPILVGGRPFNQVPDLWQVVAADATASDAVTAVATGTTLIEVGQISGAGDPVVGLQGSEAASERWAPGETSEWWAPGETSEERT